MLREMAAPTPVPTVERRIWIRYPSHIAPFSELVDAGADIHRLNALVVKISHSGLSVLTQWPLPPGLQILVELPDPVTRLPMSLVLANLVQATVQPSGEWELVCEFATELSDQDLLPFGMTAADSEAAAEQRRYVRYPCDAPAFYQILRSFDAQHWPARIVNISATGVGMLVGQPLEVGMTLKVEMGVATEKGSLRVVACVVRFNFLSAKEWLVGCNFLRQLTPAELDACRKPWESGAAATI